MSLAFQTQTISKSWLYATALFLYPFSVLFSPLINFGVIHARLDEIIIFLCAPLVIVDWKKSNYFNRTFTLKLITPYIFLTLLFCWGIILGSSLGSVTISYSRQYIFKPLYLIFIMLVVNSVLRRTRINKSIIFISLLTSLCVAGLLGFFAMRNSELSMLLIRLYNPSLEFNKYLGSAFNMSARAMSVFTGYEQASVTYGFGFIVALAMVIFLKKNRIVKLFALGSMAVLFVGMLSSARTGIVSIIGSGLLLLFLPTGRKRNSKMVLIFVALALILSWSSIFNLFPTEESSRRFDDLLNIFDSDSSTNFLQRSEGVSGLVDTQILAPSYPKGLDMVFGLGDNTKFVSDVAYVVFFIKYGFTGLLAIMYVFFCWIFFGNKMINYGLRKKINSDLMISFYILPCITILFFIAALHGHLYFLSLKTGELVSMFLGLVFFEYLSITKQNDKPQTSINRIS